MGLCLNKKLIYFPRINFYPFPQSSVHTSKRLCFLCPFLSSFWEARLDLLKLSKKNTNKKQQKELFAPFFGLSKNKEFV